MVNINELRGKHTWQLSALELFISNLGYDVAYAIIPTDEQGVLLSGYDVFLDSRKLVTKDSIEKRFADTPLSVTRFGFDCLREMHYMHVVERNDDTPAQTPGE